ncbi:MAG TPA: HAD family hydrolase [Acidimicrobiales bacterium]|nr:HAD family hydrolase [Acidimicrobiales bacterium]
MPKVPKSIERLASWRAGPTRDAIVDFLDGSDDVDPSERVAYVDNDGTMWCERPNYVQFDFFVDALRRRSRDDPEVAKRREFAAVLDGDSAAIGELGLTRVAVALASLFDRRTPGEFGSDVDAFMSQYRHPTLGVGLGGIVYQPMLELLAALRDHDFTIGIVTGGGTEFVRRIAPGLYGVPPELVVGTLIGYEFSRDPQDHPCLLRTVTRLGEANEGEPKVANIQSQLGRAPILAVGNSAGDREMLEWASAGGGDNSGLALLIDHDDADREFAYAGSAATFADVEPITEVAERLGWVTVSMRNDWSTVFAEPD